jgi:hypothetical protein
LLTLVEDVYCLGTGLDPGLTSFGAILWKGFLLSIINYFSFYLLSSTNGAIMEGPVGFLLALVLLVLLSLYLSKVDFVVL